MLKEIETYRDLLEFLKECEKQGKYLDQKIQIVDPNINDTIRVLIPGISIGILSKFEFDGARSCIDNEYNPDDLVILTDRNSFSKDGKDAVELVSINDSISLYSHGKTDPVNQLNPMKYGRGNSNNGPAPTGVKTMSSPAPPPYKKH